jgi:hypothetical protein
MFVYDENEPQEKINQRLLAAKYIELELTLSNLEAIKVIPVDMSVIKKYQLVPSDKVKPNSLHIIRKHNEFTHSNPTVHLKFPSKTEPYIVIPDIGFHNKQGQVVV